MRPLRYLRLYQALGGIYIGFIVFECLTPHPIQAPPWPHVDKLEHLVAFGLMMLWFGQLAQERRLRAGLALGFMALGGAIELAQGAMGLGRSMEFGDFAADCLGVWLAHRATLGGLGLLLVALEKALAPQR